MSLLPPDCNPCVGGSGLHSFSAQGAGQWWVLEEVGRHCIPSSAEGEAGRLGAGVEELDLESALGNRPVLADQLVPAAPRWRLLRRERPVPLGPLMVRESDILGLVAQGASNKEVARAHAERAHRRADVANVYNKIGARNRAEATAYHLRASSGQ